MIKLLAFDVDGTLTTTSNEMSDVLKQTLSIIQQKGIEIILASGRPLVDLRAFLVKNDLQFPAVILNGAAILTKEKEIRNCHCLKEETVNKICTILQENDIPFVCYGKHQSVDFPSTALSFANMMEKYLEDDESLDDLFVSYSAYDEDSFQTDHVLKIEAGIEDPDKMKQIRQLLSVFDDIHMVSSMTFNLEITSHHADKGKALFNYMEERGYEKEEVMVFGDSENDIAMFQQFPNSVLVENQKDGIAYQTAYTTGPCEDDGVARFLHSYFHL